MKSKDAFKRLHFTISKGNKPNETDIKAFNEVCEVFKQQGEKTIQENLLFAKLYAFLLKEFTMSYNNVDEANKQINKILSESMDIRVEMLLMQLKLSEVTQVFTDPILDGKNESELREIFQRHKKFEQDFIACFDWWDKDNVISHLNTNINLSIQKFKNYV